MKDYFSNNNTKEVANEIINDLNNMYKSIEVSSPTLGEGLISSFTGISYSNNTPHLKVKVLFGNETKEYSLYLILKSNKLTIKDETIKYNLLEYYSIIEQVAIKLDEEEHQRIKEAIEEAKIKKEEEKERIKQKKLEIKREKLVQANKDKANELSRSKTKITYDFFYDLGYIAKHSKHIYASLPDYLDNWFVGQFGDIERRVSDSKKLCPSGLPQNYALGFRIELDSNDNMSTSLKARLSTQNKTIKPIADTYYIFGLLKDYGFTTGKVQNIDNILDKVPESELENFRLGYNT